MHAHMYTSYKIILGPMGPHNFLTPASQPASQFGASSEPTHLLARQSFLTAGWLT